MARLMFIQNVWHECAGLMSISALVKQHGHTCSVAIGLEYDDVRSKIKEFAPDVVGLPTLIGSQDWVFSIAKKIKDEFKNIKIILGGMYPTIYPEVVKRPEVDIICRGEGEFPVLDLLNALRENRPYSRIQNLWVKDNGSVSVNELRPTIDLDSLPNYDRELFSEYAFFQMTPMVIAVDRYCPENCSFCCEHVLRKVYKGGGKFYRVRNINSIIDELKQIKEKYYLKTRINKQIIFASDNINCNRQWFAEFFERYAKEIRIPFFCSIRADALTDEQAVLLKKSGCRLVAFGLESGDERVCNEILHKRLKDEEIIRASAILRKHRIRFYTGNMFVNPGETVKEAFKTVDLNVKIKPTTVVAFILQPYPQTDIEKYAIDNNYLYSSNPSNFALTSHTKTVLNFPASDKRQLLNLHKLFIWAVKFPFLRPIIRQLIKLPENKIFDFLFLASHSVFYMKEFHNFTWPQLIKYNLSYASFYKRK